MRRAPSAHHRLLTQPHRFGFDAALRVLMRLRKTCDPSQAARFRTQPGRAFPAGEVTAVDRQAEPRVTVSLIGLIGAGGVLPRLYESLAAETSRRGSSALHDFLDLLSHRMVAAFGRAGFKYRLHRAAEVSAMAVPPRADPISTSLLAVSGYGTSGLLARLEAGPDPLLHYAGSFAMHPRSAERLSALVGDWIGRPVEVRQFTGGWIVLPPDQQTCLPRLMDAGAWNRLGVDAVVGDRAWETQGRIVLRIGPLDRNDFEALLPDQPAHRRLVSLVQAFLGLEVGFVINPVLGAGARFPLSLNGAAPPRLGWNTWTSVPVGLALPDATDATFDSVL